MKSKIFGVVITLIVLVSLTVIPAFAAPAGRWITDFTLYNLSNTDANISITRYNGFTTGGATDTGTNVKSDTIAHNGSLYYNPANDPNFPSGFNGSIVVSSSQPVAGTVTVANDLTGSGYASDAYSAVASPAPTQYLPIIMGKYSVWNTRISIQNAGNASTPAPADVTIHYVGAGAPPDDTIKGLPLNQTFQLDQYTNANMNNFNGSAVVSSTNGQNLAVVVEEYRTTGGMLVMYNGTSQADTTVYIPGYINQGAWNTDFTIVNTTGNNANVTINFTGGTQVKGVVPGNNSVYINNALPDSSWSGTFPSAAGSGYYGAATITSTQNIVVAYNIANTARGGAGNLGIGYLGFPSSQASTSVVVPLIENVYSTGWGTTFSVQSVEGTPANLSMAYSGNKTPLCNPCTYNMGANESAHTFVQGANDHVPAGFIGGVSITSDKPIVVIADQNNIVSPSYRLGDAAAGFIGFDQ